MSSNFLKDSADVLYNGKKAKGWKMRLCMEGPVYKSDSRGTAWKGNDWRDAKRMDMKRMTSRRITGKRISGMTRVERWARKRMSR
jgi:hypothetical protein